MGFLASLLTAGHSFQKLWVPASSVTVSFSITDVHLILLLKVLLPFGRTWVEPGWMQALDHFEEGAWHSAVCIIDTSGSKAQLSAAPLLVFAL